MRFALLVLLLRVEFAYSVDLDVLVAGVDDGIISTPQEDYREALIDAKLKAIERSGTEIQSESVISNWKLEFDYVEAKSKGIIRPGFQVLDIGYQKDGRYLVVLSGKVNAGNTNDDAEALFNRAKLLIDQDKNSEADFMLHEIVTSYPGSSFSQEAYKLLVDIRRKLLLMSVEDLVKGKKFDEAIQELDDFLKSDFKGSNDQLAMDLLKSVKELKNVAIEESVIIRDSFTGNREIYKETKIVYREGLDPLAVTYSASINVKKVGRIFESSTVLCIKSSEDEKCEEFVESGIYPILGSKSISSYVVSDSIVGSRLMINFRRGFNTTEFEARIN